MPAKRRGSSSSSQSAADSLSQSSSAGASPRRPPKRTKLTAAMRTVANEFRSVCGDAATGSGPPKAQKQDSEFFLCMSTVDNGKTGWFDKTPAGLKLDALCRLDALPTYKIRYLNLTSDANDGATSRAVAQALVVAQVKCFKHLYDERNANNITTPASLNTFIRDAQSRAVMFDETSQQIDVVAKYTNVTATNDLKVVVHERRGDLDSDDDDEGGFSPAPVSGMNILRLDEGGTVRFSGKLNAYDKGGLKYGVSLYIGKEIVYTAPTSLQSSDD